jgi:hypothetical protein
LGIYPIEISNETTFHEEVEIPLNETYLLYQNTLLDELIQSISHPFIHNSRIIDTFGSHGQGNLLDYIQIDHFAENGLSSSEGNNLLALATEYCHSTQCQAMSSN